jgi:MEMO1 family protein
MPCPRARRDLEFFPLSHQGRPMILVRDRLELVAAGTGFSPELLPVLELLDGARSAEDLCRELSALRGGAPVSLEELPPFLEELDAAGLLETRRYREKRAEVASAFAQSPVRRPAFAGQAYPGEPQALVRFLDDILSAAPKHRPSGRIRAVVAPHIDPEAGRTAYAAAYGVLRGAKPRRVVVLGVGHQILGGLFCLTDKTHATPLGEVPVDAEAVARLRRAGGAAVAPDDLPHRVEHSVEFQAVFLRHVLEGDFSLVPILCGATRGLLAEASRPAFLEAAGPFLAALVELVADPDTLVVAGVDLCHIGVKFGHALPAARLEKAALAHDEALLSRLCAGDAAGFWAESARVRDAYNVCGFTALAVLAELGLPGPGTVLGHDILREPPTQSAVTFAAAAFTTP